MTFDIWPWATNFDLDILLLDLHAKIQVCTSVCSAMRVVTDRHNYMKGLCTTPLSVPCPPRACIVHHAVWYKRHLLHYFFLGLKKYLWTPKNLTACEPSVVHHFKSLKSVCLLWLFCVCIVIFFLFCSGYRGVSKKNTWIVHHGIQFQKVVHNAPHGAQMPLFCYPMEHKCLSGGAVYRADRQFMWKLLHKSHLRHGLLKTKPMWTFMYVLNTAKSSTLFYYFSCISYTTTQSIPHLNKPWLSKMVWLSSAFSMRWDFIAVFQMHRLIYPKGVHSFRYFLQQYLLLPVHTTSCMC